MKAPAQQEFPGTNCALFFQDASQPTSAIDAHALQLEHQNFILNMADKTAGPLGFCYSVTLTVMFGFRAIVRAYNAGEREAYARNAADIKIAELERSEDESGDDSNRE